MAQIGSQGSTSCHYNWHPPPPTLRQVQLVAPCKSSEGVYAAVGCFLHSPFLMGEERRMQPRTPLTGNNGDKAGMGQGAADGKSACGCSSPPGMPLVQATVSEALMNLQNRRERGGRHDYLQSEATAPVRLKAGLALGVLQYICPCN